MQAPPLVVPARPGPPALRARARAGVAAPETINDVHAILDELEWKRENERLSAAERDAAVDELIELVAAVDGILQVQAKADTDYFVQQIKRTFSMDEQQAIHATVLGAYRWQYIFSGVQDPRFLAVLGSMITPAQGQRINAALGSIGSA